MSSRQVQKLPPRRWTRPRSARWKACECAFASPGSVRPSSLVAPAGGAATPLSTAAIRFPSISTSTPLSAASPPSQASSHQ